jgi:hypothetical protein
MFAWRGLEAVVCVLAVAASGWGQGVELAETVQAGDCFRIQLDMKLAGEMRIRKDGKPTPLRQEATATHQFAEWVLAVGSTGLAEKTARVYDTARAAITVGQDRSERTLRPERRLLVSQRQKDQSLVYSPAGPLLRSELEVCEHFDTLTVTGLLPGKAAAAGDTWKVPSNVAQALCSFEGLTEQGLTGKLESVTNQVATFSVSGTASGIELGAVVKLTVQAQGHFDLKNKRLVDLEWKQKDDRGQGPASPASVVECTTVLRRQPVGRPEALSDVALVSVPGDFTPPPGLLQIEYRDPKGRFSLLHPREWLLTGQTNEHVVWRLMDRGDFIAQVTLTPWTPAEKGKHLSPDDFKAAMNDTSGWRPERALEGGEVKAEKGLWVYRYSVLGELEGLSVLQNFYLVAGPGGEQIVLAFTMTPKQAEKLGARDVAFVAGLEIPAGK